jgi:hypothetical protein
MAQGEAAEDDTVSFHFEMDRSDWRDWTETVPRSQALAGRLRELIRQDRRAAARAADGDVSPESVHLMAQRVRIRATQALGAVRDGDDEKAKDQLQQITDLTEAME